MSTVTTTTTKAVNDHGGLFYVAGTDSTITIADSTHTNSITGKSGAGFYITDTGPITATISRTTFSTFTAANDAGIGYFVCTTFTMTG